jgi:hypothetical protein
MPGLTRRAAGQCTCERLDTEGSWCEYELTGCDYEGGTVEKVRRKVSCSGKRCVRCVRCTRKFSLQYGIVMQ